MFRFRGLGRCVLRGYPQTRQRSAARRAVDGQPINGRFPGATRPRNDHYILLSRASGASDSDFLPPVNAL
ncbi:hypothetical protein PLEOSDRAFT_1094530 [Pleurotus ostreatus PC15]|uniref:Uncharacterized protein n=1 Tax=Pleurotus ostreatus (strain PC15) TaxID=1137138 RepID=A0A067NDS5_PLEO1|nr:hypothetical protein PLEOSDRAFT_1094530 [Pleurotus ostreatus PC15]